MESKDLNNFISEEEVLRDVSSQQPVAVCETLGAAEVADKFPGVDLCADGVTLEVSDVSQAIPLLQYCEENGFEQLGRRSDGAAVLSNGSELAVKLSVEKQAELGGKVEQAMAEAVALQDLIGEAERTKDLGLMEKAYVRLTVLAASLVSLGVPSEAFAERTWDDRKDDITDTPGDLVDIILDIKLIGSGLMQLLVMILMGIACVAPAYPLYKTKEGVSAGIRIVGQALSGHKGQIEESTKWMSDTAHRINSEVNSPSNPQGVIPAMYAGEAKKLNSSVLKLDAALKTTLHTLGSTGSILDGVSSNKVQAKPVALRVKEMTSIVDQMRMMFLQVQTDGIDEAWQVVQHQQFDALVRQFNQAVAMLSHDAKPMAAPGTGGKTLAALLFSIALTFGSCNFVNVLSKTSVFKDADGAKKANSDKKDNNGSGKSKPEKDEEDDESIFDGMENDVDKVLNGK